jgi:hypothetical protein
MGTRYPTQATVRLEWGTQNLLLGQKASRLSHPTVVAGQKASHNYSTQRLLVGRKADYNVRQQPDALAKPSLAIRALPA